MNVFELRNSLVSEYGSYTQSFIAIRDAALRSRVQERIDQGELWPDPLLQLNPSYESGGSIDELVANQVLHRECARIFRRKRDGSDVGTPLQLYRHQVEAISVAARGEPYVVTTGTGSGKSLTYIVPIVDHVLRRGSGRGIQAIVIYPMNALANSQFDELEKYLQRGYPDGVPPVSYARYTGQEPAAERRRIIESPPDILLTNYVMLELLLTRRDERALINSARDLRYLVLDELHTYRGRQGADVAMLVRRCRQAFSEDRLTCVGTSATMATDGSRSERRRVIAQVATSIFGQSVGPDQIIDETLTRTALPRDFSRDADRRELAQTVTELAANPPSGAVPFDSLVSSPLAAWIEDVFGLSTEPDSTRLRRARPRPVAGPDGASSSLVELTGLPLASCEAAIRATLELGSRVRHPITGLPVFAFRLHQFVTRGDTVWASLEPPGQWHIALRGQKFVPGDRTRVLLPLCFCKDCGHHFYRVDRVRRGDAVSIEPRLRFDLNRDEAAESGYLFQAEDPSRDWPADAESATERYPPDWIDRAGDRPRVRRNRRDDCPEWVTLDPSGSVSATGRRFLFLKAPFSFCPHCDTAYPKRERNDMSKLRTLGVDSRSTATTILALNAVQQLKLDPELDPEAKKLLSFTDNRQDASLQAGHFNDFVEVALVRSGLVRALKQAGVAGLRFSTLSQAVFDALELPFDQYSAQPEARFAKRHEIDRVFRKTLGCRLYRDLLRGWRISSPNLEQCGLLRFEYESLKEVCGDEASWTTSHRLLREAPPETRLKICSTLLDSLRRALAIEAEELSPQWLEQTSREASDYLLEEWALGDTTRSQQVAPIVWPRSLTDQDQGEDIPVSSASKFGQFLRRPTTFGQTVTLSMQETDSIISDLFRVLEHDFLRPVHAPRTPNGPKGYRLGGETLIWHLGDGSPAVDPLRQERVSNEGSKANQFFHKFYCEFAGLGGFLTAREHTAQVGADERKKREERFKSAQLPILFCSPTMELGVDIAQLNVVNMRNMPPTPANYAQRSGRAGRGGQPALVYTYCSGFSPHDQYFFSRPDQMVAGSVQPPRIELANEALLRAHIHAIWLGETGADLGKTLADVLVVSEERLELPIRPDILEQMTSRDAETSAIQKADRLLNRVRGELSDASWFDDTWLERTIKGAARSLDAACERWRDLYIAAVKQRRLQNQIIGDHGRSEADRKLARSLRQQAEAQIELLTNSSGRAEGDFYSYRYFASEGFLPGYSFPRLPVSAFVPGRRGTVGEHEYLNRPRFLAISEFGPNAIIYHEGARYRIHRANVALDVDGSGPSLSMMKTCSECGYAHMGSGLADLQVCARCATPLEQQHEFSRLVRMQNVSARRLERITSDEEERQRQGYDVRCYFAFPTLGGLLARRTGRAEHPSGTVAHMEYGDTCSLWRLNLGWARRQHGTDHGFFLDLEKGEWVSRDDAEVQDGVAAARPNAQRVIPFVSDTKNALLFTPRMIGSSEGFMPSLEAALRRGIQHVFQVESSEIAVDSLPSRQRRNHLLFYEASEGGAGVLRQLLEPGNLGRVANAALELCHFDLKTNEDRGHSHKDGCEAACYDCLLDFGNQGDHRLIDRTLVNDFLRMLAASTVVAGDAPPPVGDPWHRLYSLCDSQLEKRFLDVLRQHEFRRPDHAQFWIPERYSRPDFFYAQGSVCVFIDGPPHDEPEQAEEDAAVRDRLVSDGYQVLVFHHARTDWMALIRSHPAVFGTEAPRGPQ